MIFKLQFHTTLVCIHTTQMTQFQDRTEGLQVKSFQTQMDGFLVLLLTDRAPIPASERPPAVLLK